MQCQPSCQAQSTALLPAMAAKFLAIISPDAPQCAHLSQKFWLAAKGSKEGVVTEKGIVGEPSSRDLAQDLKRQRRLPHLCIDGNDGMPSMMTIGQNLAVAHRLPSRFDC